MKFIYSTIVSIILLYGCGQITQKKSSKSNFVEIHDSVIVVKTKLEELKFVGLPNQEEEIAKFEYLGFNRNVGFHAVKGSFWEESEVYLIDHETAKIDTIWNNPIYSPNDTLIACTSMEYGLEGVPNGFQVYKLSENRIWVKIKELNQKEWVPRKLEWSNNQEIIVSTTPVEKYYEDGIPTQRIFESKKFRIE